MSFIKRNFFVCLFFVLSNSLYAKVGKTLIDKKLKPDIAKSYKKQGDNTFIFVIDPSKKIKSGSKQIPVTFEMIEKSLLRRIGKKFGAKVTGNAQKVTVTFTKGDEKKLLKTISKAKIKAASGINIASSVSDGGVRARTATRDPVKGEIKGAISDIISNNYILVEVLKNNSTFKSIPLKKNIMLQYKNYKGLNGELIYFYPTGKSKDPKTSKEFWQAKKFSKK